MQHHDLPTLTVLVEGYAKKTPDGWVASRKLLIERADYIVPGHGKMFAVQK